MKRIPQLLSKTKLLDGYRCHKCIYLTIHHPELKAPVTPELQALFDQGNRVGAEARKFFPGGTLVDKLPWDFGGALAETRGLIEAGANIIYEAAFEYKGFYARADIIERNPETDKWHIYEVKSSTKLKPEHLNDAGLQAWIMAKAGLKLEQINLMHLNPECRYPDLSQLFKTQDITEEIRGIYTSIQPRVHEIATIIRQPEVPNIDIGPYCQEPTTCGFIEHCWKEKEIPALSIFNLPGLRDRKWELYYQGITALDDPRLTELSELQERIVRAYKTGKAFSDQAAIQEALAPWEFPLIFLDFETINPAIPRYPGCGPYHQLPFQFSVHTWLDPLAELSHQEFLWDKTSDPRPALIPALLNACGSKGSIVAYHAKFEADRIKEMAACFPEHQTELTALLSRMVDPLPIIRSHVYDNAFAGSFSLKKVAPALLGEEHSYETMLVGDGGAAQRAFEDLISVKTPAAKKERIREAMLEYCKKDTLVMVELVKWLYAQGKEAPDTST